VTADTSTSQEGDKGLQRIGLFALQSWQQLPAVATPAFLCS
jgi:hypothetical protein